ncbi:MAG: GIY-YIG nuclease family protein [Chloroflexi bacterium]|nr:GIY-YIG nuclease family protein [Chloroflexota bacterium]
MVKVWSPRIGDYRLYPMGDALFITLDGELVDRSDLLKVIESLEFAADMLLTTTPDDYRNIYTDHVIQSLEDKRIIWSPDRYAHEYGSGVYFFQSGNKIKIGQTADFDQRIHKLRYRYGSDSKMLAWIETGQYKQIEKLLHRRFSRINTFGDWFSPIDEILQWLEELQGA